MHIDEEIAVAEAEEEVRREMEARKNSREAEREQVFYPRYDDSVRVSIDEIIRLNLIENDFNYLLNTLIDYADVVNGRLKFDDEKVNNILHLIAPEAVAERMARNGLV